MRIMRTARLFGVAALVVWGIGLYAQPTTYTYTGNAFTSVLNAQGSTEPYTTSDFISGSIVTLNPLPPNLSLVNISPPSPKVSYQILSFSFFDGVNTWDSTNSGINPAIVSTDSQGAIIVWFLIIKGASPPFPFNNFSFLITCSGNNLDPECGAPGTNGAGGGDQVSILTGPSLFNSTFVGGSVFGAPGTWGAKCPMVVHPSVRQCASSLVQCQQSDGTPFALMYAEASAPDGSNLLKAAASCQFTTFEWQQKITNLPCPSGVLPDLDTLIPPQNFCPPGDAFDGQDLTATAGNPLFDPPPGGTQNDQKPGQPLYNPYPFFYPLKSVQAAEASPGDSSFCPPNAFVCLVTADNKLTFFDVPRGGWPDTPASPDPDDCCSKQFTTTLVGVSSQPVNEKSQPCAPGDNRFCTPLYWWNWNSTFNGTAGGVSIGNDIGIDQDLPDPGSGTGGITITNLNGAPQTPPTVTCTATPTSLWPPDGKPVTVTVSGTVNAGTQAISTGGTTFAVVDEYQQVQPSGSFTVDGGGNFSFTVELIASRDGNDKDGRTYRIDSIARDNIGNPGICSSVVTVPHDQGN